MSTEEQAILTELESIEGNGAFVCSGIQKLTLPGLHIEGLGEIGLPLNSIQLSGMIQKAHKAPFGKGSETILDPAIRSAWEIDAIELSFHNPEWESTMKKLVKKVKVGLGIEAISIKHSLYKLLIYEEGDFFLPHKDSEKEPGMFGTLIVGLPSAHTGGELYVRFEGQSETIDFSSLASNYQMPYAAFYADCEHEIKPVSSGYRVCLVYNLSRTSTSSPIPLPSYSRQKDVLTNLLRAWEASGKQFPRAILLGHEYTPANFSRDSLKHHDYPRAEVLMAAAKEAGFFAQLGLLTHYQMGELEPDYSSNRRRRYWEEPEEAGEATMGEIYETRTEIEHWMEGAQPDLGDLSLEEDAIVSPIEIGEGEPTETEEDWYTGNAGMTMEYWYHYGAVILWPIKQHKDILAARPLSTRIPWLTFYLQHWEEERFQSEEMVRQVILALKDLEIESGWNYSVEFQPVIEGFIKLEDEAFLITNGPQILIAIFEKVSAETWIRLLSSYRVEIFEPIFQKVGMEGKLSRTNHLLGILEHGISEKESHISSFLFQQIDQLPQYLSKIKFHKLKSSYDYLEDKSRKELITEIVQKLLVISELKNEDEPWTQSVLAHLVRKLNRTYVNEVLLKVLKVHSFRVSSLSDALLSASLEDLRKRVRNQPQPPKDWSRKVPKSKSTYNKEVWEMLAPFLTSPTETVFEYRKNQSHRSQVESTISSVTIDLKTETIKKGSPHTLKITKTTAAYERNLQAWQEDVEFLKKWSV